MDAQMIAKRLDNYRKYRLWGEGVIDTGEYVQIGGIKQFIYHRGRDLSNPVLVYLHGGPGSPKLPFAQEYQVLWDSFLTIVNWDQRGCGKTLLANPGVDLSQSATIEQLVSDLDEIVDHVRKKYNKQKVFIAGHSWGTVLGSTYVKKFPDKVLAYIAFSQVVEMVSNEVVSYQKCLEIVKEKGTKADYERLASIAPYPHPEYGSESNRKLDVLREIQGKYGIITITNDDMYYSPFYGVLDYAYFKMDRLSLNTHLVKYLMYDFDLYKAGLDFKMPVYFMMGEKDLVTLYEKAKEAFEKLTAPKKKFYSVPDTGHSPMIDVPEAGEKMLREIVAEIKE